MSGRFSSRIERSFRQWTQCWFRTCTGPDLSS